MRSKGLSRAESVELYRQIREKTGAPVFKSYLSNHPRVTSKISNQITGARSNQGAAPVSPDQLPAMQSRELSHRPRFDDEGESSGGGGGSSRGARGRDSDDDDDDFDAGAFDDLDALEFDASEDGGDVYE